MCGAGHTFAAGVQNDERNRKQGVGCISIYSYANSSVFSEMYFSSSLGSGGHICLMCYQLLGLLCVYANAAHIHTHIRTFIPVC